MAVFLAGPIPPSAWALLALAVAAVLFSLWAWLRPAAQKVDLRATGRIPLEVPVRMRVGEHVLEAISSDVARGGMCVRAAITGSAGQPVELEFALPGVPQMLVYGVVRWKKPDSIGVLFDVQSKHHHLVTAWIDAQQPETVET